MREPPCYASALGLSPGVAKVVHGERGRHRIDHHRTFDTRQVLAPIAAIDFNDLTELLRPSR